MNRGARRTSTAYTERRRVRSVRLFSFLIRYFPGPAVWEVYLRMRHHKFGGLIGAVTLAGAALLAVLAAPQSASAFPAFVAKEGKPCAYCHVNPKGGGKRNYRGVYYKMNANSFAKFDDAAEAKKAGEEIGPEPTPPPKSYTPAGATDTPPPAKVPEKPAGDPKTPTSTSSVKAAQKADVRPQLKAAIVAYKKAEAPYRKAPANAANKKAFANAMASVAHETMLEPSIPPNLRYSSALKMTRQVLALDPKNTKAAADKKAIEAAYTSMGRPIPK